MGISIWNPRRISYLLDIILRRSHNVVYLLADFDSINITIVIIVHLTHTSYIPLQDKYLQKMHFKQHGVALPEFMKIDSLSAAVEAGKIFGYPLMLKSKRLAYDGRGNAVAKSEEVLPVAIAALGGIERGLYVEKWAPFVKELAVIVARGRNACICSFPVVETTHKDSICHTVVSPAQVAPDIAEAAMQVAERAVGSLSGAGIFGVELFLLEDGKVLLNEVAPRPHNNGHHTLWLRLPSRMRQTQDSQRCACWVSRACEQKIWQTGAGWEACEARSPRRLRTDRISTAWMKT